MKRTLGLYGTLELHELITHKSLCLTKSAILSAISQELDVQTILLDDKKNEQEHIQYLKEFLTNTGEHSWQISYK